MKGNDPNFSRVNRKRRKGKSNQLLNILIGLVVVMILIVGAFIIIGPKDEKGKDLATEENADQSDANASNDDQENDKEDLSLVEESDGKSESENTSEDDQSTEQSSSGEGSNSQSGSTDTEDEGKSDDEPGTVTIVPNDEDIIEESVINTAWKPIGTDQTGVHESKYDGESVDWNEKKKAISYATGFNEEELIFWKIKNGGSPQKSVGIVSTKDETKKFRVFLEWVDEKGWQPVKMDKLSTLDFEY